MRLITLILIVLLAPLLISCGAQIRPDPAPPAIDASYPTVEMYVDGKLYHGAAVAYKPDLNFKFEIQGYYSGEIRVASKNCNIDQTYTYQNHERVLVKFPSPSLTRSCFFVVTMSPSYPGEEHGVPVSSLRGFLALKAKTQDRQAYGRALKVQNPARGSIEIPVGNVPSARIVLGGCGLRYDKTLVPSAGKVTVRLEEVIEQFQGFCALDGVAITEEFQDLVLFAGVASYGPSYAPLAIPAVSIDKNKLSVTAEEGVGVLALDAIYVLKNKTTFDFDPSKKGQILRLITTKGRTALGVWDGKAFAWMQ